MTSDDPYAGTRRRPAIPTVGRPQATTRASLSTLAIDLFVERGFDATSMDDIAEAAGISRRTLFRYYPSKNSIPWGDFDVHLARLRAVLADQPDELPLSESLRRGLIAFNTVPDDESDHHRRRMNLLLNVPALQAHSMIMYADWRHVLAEHCARRLAVAATAQLPQTLAWIALGVALSAYEQWLSTPDSDLIELIDNGCRLLINGADVIDERPRGFGSVELTP